MPELSAKLIRHEICKDEIERLGGTITEIQDVMFYVNFDFENHSIVYLYHLTRDNAYTLKRIKPYTLYLGDFNDEEEIIDGIKIDIEQFKNAMKSKNYSYFINIDNDITKLARIFEDLFLYYNVNEESLNNINNEIKQMLHSINTIKEESERVYFDKEPDVL